MIIHTATGATWRIHDAPRKLVCRARMPGGRIFDHATDSLRRAKQAGLAPEDRLVLALPASWLVNSPAISRVLRRWALPPQKETWLALIEVLETGDMPLLGEAVKEWIGQLGEEPYVVEAASKILALVVPDVVPLMPPRARDLVLGAGVPGDGAAFVAMVTWFLRETRANADALAALATQHKDVPLSGPQALDRLLWFDSDGYQHFKEEGLEGATLTAAP